MPLTRVIANSDVASVSARVRNLQRISALLQLSAQLFGVNMHASKVTITALLALGMAGCGEQQGGETTAEAAQDVAEARVDAQEHVADARTEAQDEALEAREDVIK